MTSLGASIPVSRYRPAGPAAAAPAVRSGPLTREEKYTLAVVVFCFGLQLGLFFLGTSSLRLPMRVANYAVSFAMLFLIKGKRRGHPAVRLIPYIVAVLCLGFLNPAGDTFLARFAQSMTYFCVLAPLIWAGRCPMQPRAFRWIMLMFWAFYTASATFGVLQVHDPERFKNPAAEAYGDQALAAHTFKLADGETFIRPTGLTDAPGGASAASLYSIVIGLGLLLSERRIIMKALIAVSMVVALYCIYISEIRINLIIVLIVGISVPIVLARRGAYKQALLIGTVTASIAVVGTTIAFAVGGQEVFNRFVNSFSSDPGQTVYNERGRFLEELVTQDMGSYFLGAGQGRWGMSYTYFGHTTRPLWAEMMWQALLYDGGVPLMVLYIAILFMLLSFSLKLARDARSDTIASWAAVVLGLNVASIAASFVFPVYTVQLGLEVFLINGCLYATAEFEKMTRRQQGARVRPAVVIGPRYSAAPRNRLSPSA